MTSLITAMLFVGVVGVALALAVRLVQRKAGGAFAAYVRERNQAIVAALNEAGWRWDGAGGPQAGAATDDAEIDTTAFRPRGIYKGQPLQLTFWNADQAPTFEITASINPMDALGARAELFLAPSKGAVGMVAALAYSERQQTHIETGSEAFDEAYFLSAAPPGFAADLLARHPALLDQILRFKYLTALLQHGRLLVQANLQNQPELLAADSMISALEIAWALADTLRPATSPPAART